MSPRRRKNQNRGLPSNLYRNGASFKYRNPLTGKSVSWTVDEETARKTAILLNEKFADAVAQKLIDKSLNRKSNRITVSDVIAGFRQDYLPEKNLSAGTLDNKEYKLKKYEREVGRELFCDMTVTRLNEYFEAFTKAAYVKHRQLWVELFAYAISKGYVPVGQNHADALLRKAEPKRQRQRLDSFEIYKKIHQQAPEWLQIAMDFSLLSLQPREIVCVVRHDQYVDGRVKVIRKKTGDYLDIGVGAGLHEVFERSRKSPVASQYVVHRVPEARRKARDRAHWSQLAPNYITKGFKKAVEASGLFENVPRETWPTFHEIISLGQELYKKAGYSLADIQKLRGHEDEKTTKHYFKDREPDWIQVEAFLNLKDLK
jgi:integrase